MPLPIEICCPTGFSFLGRYSFCQRLVDQHHARRSSRVLVGEFAPAQYRNLERLVITR